MKKLILFALLVYLIPFQGFSQTEKMYRLSSKTGYIHLKNGKVIKGKYMYSGNLDKIVVMTYDSTVVLSTDEVDKITHFNLSDKSRVEKSMYSKQLKIFNLSEIGFLVGNQDNANKMPLIVHSSFNYLFTDALSAGIGVGVELFKETYLPVIANIMYQLGKDNRMKPYISLQGGYEIPVEGSRMSYVEIMPKVPYYQGMMNYYPYYSTTELKTRGGFLINPSVGFTYQLSSGFGLGLSLGYRFHSLNYFGDENYQLRVDYNRLSVKLGFIFN